MNDCHHHCGFREALDAMRDMVLIKGPESRLLWANASFRDYYGMTEDELRNMVDGPQSDPDDTLQYVRDDRTVFETGAHLDVPVEVVTGANGSQADFHTIKSPITENGTVVQCVGVSRRNDDPALDTRAISHAEAKAMAKPLRLVTSAFPLPIALVDVQGRVVSISPLWRSTFGSGGDAAHSYLLECYPDLAQLAEPLATALADDLPDPVHTRLTVNGGRTVFDMRVGSWQYADGTTGGVMIVAMDVTQEAARLAEIAEWNERYNLVVEGASVGIWDWPDVSADDEYWSDRFYELLGYEPGEIPASLTTFRNLLHPDDRERTFAKVADHLEDGATFDLEYRLRSKSGAYRWYRGSGASARDDDDNPTRMVGSIQDIDARVHAEHAARRVNEDLEHFVHVAAHDLREPARRQIMLAELIQAQHGDDLDPALQRQLVQVQEQGHKMLAMVTGFRSLTGIAGPTLDIEKVDLGDMVSALATELVDADDAVEVNVDLGAKVLGYPTLLEIMFRNLIRNALVHGPRPLTIDMTEREVEDRRIFAVASTFAGDPSRISDADLFKPFVQKDQSADGSGLGLSICRRVVDRHRGKIWIEPSDDTFTIKFTLGEQQ